MNYQVGDTVIHHTYGPGKIQAVDDKGQPGEPCFYYVIEASERILWVPVIENAGSSLHLPLQPSEFGRLLNILRSPGEKLSDNAFKRKGQIENYRNKRTLDDACLLIRDLAARSRSRKLSQNEIGVLKQAEAFLLDEWVHSLGTPRDTARRELEWLLKEKPKK